MSSSLAAEYDIVHLTVVDSTCVTVVGEYHDSVQSQQLIQRVLSAVEPTAVCVELCPERYDDRPNHGPLLYREKETPYTRGVSTLEEYARENELPVYLIDELYRIIKKYDEPISMSPPRPDPDGDIPLKELRSFRGSVQEKHPEYFEKVLQRREEVMAAHVRAVARNNRGPIVVVVGAAHAEPVSSLLPKVESKDVSKRLVQNVK